MILPELTQSLTPTASKHSFIFEVREYDNAARPDLKWLYSEKDLYLEEKFTQ